jgi:hypothetical protein
MRQTFFLSVAAILAACSGPARTGTAPTSKIGDDAVSHVQLTITGIAKEDADHFKVQLEDQGHVENVMLRSFQQGTATYELDIKGCECDLPSKVAAIQHPGFKYEGRTTQIHYSAFDNQPPTVTFVFPQEGKVSNTAEVWATVEVPDQDLSQVTINGVPAEHFKGNLYRARLTLKDGLTDLIAVARDKAGNEGKAQVRAAVDTTPPALEATVKVVVEGTVEAGSTVLINGNEIAVDANGRYKAEIPIRKGQREVEIVAVDKNGNKNIIKKDIGN